MRKLIRFTGWFIVLLLVPLIIGVYGALPYVLAELVKWELVQRGFKKPEITFAYPDLNQLTVSHLSLEKNTDSGVILLTVQDGIVTYHPSQLFQGHLSHIYVTDAMIRVIPSEIREGQDEDQSRSPSSGLTMESILRPLPPLPFQRFTIESLIVVKEGKEVSPQKLGISGDLENHDGRVRGNFQAQGPQTPAYQVVVEGHSLGNMNVTLLRTDDSSTEIWKSHVQSIPQDDHIHINGQMTTDIHELTRFLAHMVLVPQIVMEVRGRLELNWDGDGPRSASLGGFSSKADMKFSGNFQFQGTVPAETQRVKDLKLDLVGHFAMQAGAVQWDLSPRTVIEGVFPVKQETLPTPIQSLIQEEDLPLLVSFPKGIQGRLLKKDSHFAFEVRETGCVQVDSAKSQIVIQLCLTDWNGLAVSPIQAKGQYALSLSMPPSGFGPLEFEGATWDVKGSLGFHEDTIMLSLDTNSIVKFVAPRRLDLSLPYVSLQVRDTVVAHYRQGRKELTISQGILDLHTPTVHWKDRKVAIQGAIVSLKKIYHDGLTWSAKGAIELQGVSTIIGTQEPPVTNWSADFVLDPSEVVVVLTGHSKSKPIALNARLRHSWKTHQGVLQAKLLPLSFSATGFLLSEVLQPWTFPFDIASGKLSALAHLFWEKSPVSGDNSYSLKTSEVEIGLRGLSGHYKKVIFQDVSTHLILRGAQQWVTTKPVLVTLRTLHSGIDANDISGHLHAVFNPFTQSYRLQVKDFSSALFGGLVTSRMMTFDSRDAQQKFTLDVKNIQLADLLHLEQQEGLDGTGVLDGTIPLSMEKSGVVVHEGMVEAREPGGVIEYHTAKETLASLSHLGPQMELVVDALENFHYHHLRAGVDYSHDGTLNLRIRLEGKNPDLQKGRPIHINFNLEENIPSLLKSLAIVRGIEKDIERMLNQPSGLFPGN